MDVAPPASHSSHQLLHSGPDPHRHLLYFDLVIPNAKTVGLDHVGSYRHSLAHAMDKLYKVGSTISLFPYGLPFSEESEILKYGSTLEDTLSQLSNYFDSLHLTREAFPPLFVSVLLGFDSDAELFAPNCQAQFDGIGARITLCPLQSPKVSGAGWIFGTHGNSDPAHMEKLIQEALDSTYPGHGLCLGFCLKQLWSGAKKTKQTTTTKATTPPTHQPPGLHVVHIDCEPDHETAVKAMIRAVLHLPSFSSYSNLPLHLVDILRFNSSEEERETFASTYKQQSSISASLSQATSHNIIKLDSPSSVPPTMGHSTT